MAIRYLAVSAAGVVANTLNNQATLIADAITAVAAAETANASNDADAEIAAADAAVDLIAANQPSGAVVVAVDLAQVTTKNQLRQLLDAAYTHLATSTNTLT